MEYDKLTIGLIAVAGSILVATLTYYYTKSLERLKQNTNLKVQAYVDYIKGITGTAGGKEVDRQKMAEYNSLILDAKMRIALYGSPNTVKKLSDLCANGNEITSEAGIKRLLGVMNSMRNDFDKTTVNNDDIYRLLYNDHPKSSND